MAKPPVRTRDGRRGNEVAGLVAIEGVHGPAVSNAATTLARELTARQVTCGVSRWDASGLFGDVASSPIDTRDVSPRTLILLFAADLAFRLRWEIVPAVASGLIVIVAPYVATATAFGVAAGLSHDWLRTLFRFAPVAAHRAVLAEANRKRVWKRRPDRGFGECCTALLEATPQGFARKKTRHVMYDVLTSASNKHGELLRRKDMRVLAEEIRGEGQGGTKN